MSVKSRLAARIRHLVAAAVEPRFDQVDARFDRLEARFDTVDDHLRAADVGYPSTRVEHDLFALRQQMEEVLDLLRAQHARLRALEEGNGGPTSTRS